jgi:hypothetical protein
MPRATPVLSVVQRVPKRRLATGQGSRTHSEFSAAPDADNEAPFRRFGTKVCRNDPCPAVRARSEEVHPRRPIGQQ